MTASRILRLQVENFMRVVAIDISPEGFLIPITGKNAEGKSSVINAIWAALQWRAAAGSIPEPVRRGQNKATVRIDLGDLIITRTWKGDDSKLQVTTREGAKYPSPQSVLDKLVSELGYDPLAFVRMQPRDQRTALMSLLKIDFSSLDEERAGLLRDKSVTSAHISGLQQQLNGIPQVPEETPDEEISASDILKQIQAATNQESKRDWITNEIASNDRIIDDFKKEIKVLEKKIKTFVEIQEDLEQKLQTVGTPEPIEPLQEQLKNIEETNKAVRLKQQTTKLNADLEAKDVELQQIEEAIADIDQDKRDALAASQFPVPGLSFDESGILLNGIPFAQASTAEQIRVSLAMGISMNPTLKVLLIRDGSALDSDALRMVEEIAQQNEMQIWMERVDESGQMGIVIEGGEIKGTKQAELPAEVA